MTMLRFYKRLTTVFVSFHILFSPFLIAEQRPLTIERLANQKFQSYYGVGMANYTFVVIFTAEGTYSTEIGSDLGHEDGTYEIIGDHVALQGKHCPEIPGFQKSSACAFAPATCRAESTPESLYYSEYLVCQSDHTLTFVMNQATDSMRMPFPKSAVPFGQKKSFNGIAVITMGRAKGKTIDAVKIRKTPSINGEAKSYYPFPSDPPSPQPFVPAGAGVIVIARTINKEAVKGWNNYWYLVNVGENREVWMFAEFVKLDK